MSPNGWSFSFVQNLILNPREICKKWEREEEIREEVKDDTNDHRWGQEKSEEEMKKSRSKSVSLQAWFMIFFLSFPSQSKCPLVILLIFSVSLLFFPLTWFTMGCIIFPYHIFVDKLHLRHQFLWEVDLFLFPQRMGYKTSHLIFQSIKGKEICVCQSWVQYSNTAAKVYCPKNPSVHFSWYSGITHQ